MTPPPSPSGLSLPREGGSKRLLSVGGVKRTTRPMQAVKDPPTRRRVAYAGRKILGVSRAYLTLAVRLTGSHSRSRFRSPSTR